MLTLLLSMHLLAAPLALTPPTDPRRLHLVDPARRRGLESMLGAAVLALPLAAAPWAAGTFFSTLPGCCSTGLLRDVGPLQVGLLLFEVLGVPSLAALSVRLVAKLSGDPGELWEGYVGALVGNLVGLPAGLLVLVAGVAMAGWGPGALLGLLAGVGVQGAFAALGASIGQHWSDAPMEAAPLFAPTEIPQPPEFGPPPTTRLVVPVFTATFG
jgi:hypothetical protein